MVSQLMKVRGDPANNVGAPERRYWEPKRRACAPAPDNTSDCMPSEGYTHSIGSVRGASDGTLWVSNGDGVSPGDGLPPADLRPGEHGREDPSHRPRRERGARTPVLPGGRQPRPRLHEGVRRRASATRSASLCARAGGSLWATSAGGGPRGDRSDRSRGPQLRLALLPRRDPSTPEYQTEPECTTEYARPPGTHTSPTYDYPHAGSNAVVTGPTYTGARYPPQYRGSLFFGDFTGGFIRRLLPNGSGGLRGAALRRGRRGVALESAPGGDLVTVSPGGFQAGEGRVSRIVYTPPRSVAPSPPAAPAPMLPADTAGPRLRLHEVQPAPRGISTRDGVRSGGVRSVKVALRRRRLPRGGCARGGLRPRRRLSHGRKSCDWPRWMRARLRRREGRVLWSVR